MSFIASGLAIAGLSEAALTVAAGEAIGAGIGALTNPKNPGMGALMGGLGGAVTGGIGAGIGGLVGGAASGAAEGVAGEVGALSTAAEQAGAPTLGSTFGALGAEPVAAPLANVGGTTLGQIAESGGVGSVGGLGGSTLANVGKTVATNFGPDILKTGAGAINQSIANAQTQKESDKIHQQYFGGFGGFAHGGEVQHVARQGGSVKLRDGAFVVPADVVSALGNGSSKAGAKYLTHLCRMLEAGPPPEVGSIARSRARV